MANANWNGGQAKSRSQAKAWLRHNDKDRREDPQVNHTNRDIDQSLTHQNFEVGPTAGMSYEEKCERLDGILDRYGYPTDKEIRDSQKTPPISMQGIVGYPPDELCTPEAIADGRLKMWCELWAETVCKQFGAENVIAMYVDLDEQHEYKSSIPGEEGKIRRAKPHVHTYVAPVCEYKVPDRMPIFLTPDGKETTNEAEAEKVYKNKQGGETDDPAEARIGEDGEPEMTPRCARTKSGRRKYKKQKKSEATKKETKLRGSEFFTTSRVIELNNAVDAMTHERFGIKWNTKEPRDPNRKNKTIDELKDTSAELLDVDLQKQAEAEIAANVEASRKLLEDTQATATQMKVDAQAEVDAMLQKRNEMAGDVYTGDDGKRYYGVKGLRAKLAETVNERKQEEKKRDDAKAEAATIKSDAQTEAVTIKQSAENDAETIRSRAVAAATATQQAAEKDAAETRRKANEDAAATRNQASSILAVVKQAQEDAKRRDEAREQMGPRLEDEPIPNIIEHWLDAVWKVSDETSDPDGVRNAVNTIRDFNCYDHGEDYPTDRPNEVCFRYNAGDEEPVYRVPDDLTLRVMEVMTDAWNGVKDRVRKAARKTFEVFTARVAQRVVEAEKMLGRDVSASEVDGRGGDDFTFVSEIRDDEPSNDGWSCEF